MEIEMHFQNYLYDFALFITFANSDVFFVRKASYEVNIDHKKFKKKEIIKSDRFLCFFDPAICLTKGNQIHYMEKSSILHKGKKDTFEIGLMDPLRES